MRSIRTRQATGDEGFGMVLVLGLSTVLGLLIVAAVALSTNALRSSQQHSAFEGALAVSEAGVDTVLTQINATYNSTGTTFTTSAPCAMTAPSTFSTVEAERTWAKNALNALPDSCLSTTATGQFIAVRPTNRQAVYSMGWSPNRTAARGKNRMVKAEYLFAPYKPSNAVLTQGGLDFSGSVTVNAPSTTTSADVHTNTDITGYNNSLNIAGAVSASGTLPGGCPAGVTGGCTASAAVQSLPTIRARTYYDKQAHSLRNNGWYDLCPGGQVKRPSDTLGSAPCSGTVLNPSGGSYNGWEFAPGSGTTPDTWTLPRTAGGPFPGVYYAYQSNAVVGSTGNSSDTWQITVLAEADGTVVNPATCGKKGGNISWKLFNLQPRLSGLQFLADANLTGDANATAGSGLFLAGDKIDLQTSSSVLTGAVVATNSCAAAGANIIQGVTINYDDTIEAPLSDLVRTTLWLEYPAG